ncbi:MAG TPA: acetyl-CoA acetyltransferase [Actinomycetota bacterium]
MRRRRVAIVGIGESRSGEVPDATHWQLHREAASAAFVDAGLSPADVDGLFSCGADLMHPVQLGEYLGLRPDYVDGTQVGGSSWEFFVHHAIGAIEAGLCDVALLNYATTSRSDLKRKTRSANVAIDARGPAQFESAYGHTVIGRHAMAATRHMHEFGTTPEQLAAIAVQARANAALNPNAMYRDPLTVEDVLSSREICSPLHKLDCCIRSDGGGAVLLVGEDRARSLNKEPVWLLGAGEATSHHTMSEWKDFTESPARRSARRAFAMAGVKPDEIDVVQVYDSFTITVLLTLEAMGFCSRGEGGAFVENGRLLIDGDLPTNTDGGGLSSNHPGMRGIFLIIEAVRQLRGEAGDRQVKRAQLAAVNGTGGWFSSTGTLVLGVEQAVRAEEKTGAAHAEVDAGAAPFASDEVLDAVSTKRIPVGAGSTASKEADPRSSEPRDA